MADVKEQKSALWRRQEQLDRWDTSETNKESAKPRTSIRIQFQDGCVFLAACSSGDTDEVQNLLSRGADINTSNIDGLTALHQACIDDNIDMVKFLVLHKAEIDACDNEGWTPLHATASCGFNEIAKYLIEQGAAVGAVNNDGELPIDIAEGDDMEELLLDEMEKQGIDAEQARGEEEEVMLTDANQWLSLGNFVETKHPKTGATALHVAASKGYIKVMDLLIQAGTDVDAQDEDGWSSLHAAAHWGMEESCKFLAEHFAAMDIKNKSGQTPFDVADTDLLPFLEELKKKQAILRKNKEADLKQMNSRAPAPLKRRSSVTRMSMDQKQNVVLRTAEEERAHLAAMMQKRNEEQKATTMSSSSEEVSSDSETEKQNQKNRQQAGSQDSTQRRPVSVGGMGDNQESRNSSRIERSLFEPPKRDEERETERKARARRARESRRSTQGVTKEDLVRAEETLKAADSKDTSSRKEEVSSSQEDSRSDKENRPEETSSVLRRTRPAWDKDDDSNRTSLRKSGDSALDATTTGTTGYLRSLRNTSSTPSIKNNSDLDAFISTTYRSKYLRPKTDSTDQKEDKERELRKEEREKERERDKERDKEKEDKEDPSQKSSAIRTRRKRESRRPTGKISLEDIQAGSEENESKSKVQEKKEEDKTSGTTRYSGSSSPYLSDRYSRSSTSSDRPSSYTPSTYTRSYTASTIDKDLDYKKLYEEEKVANERLKKDLKKTQEELSDSKSELDRLKPLGDSSRLHSESSSERRERRALERKLSEMEEELKQMDKIRKENAKLKEENRALTRVVSKLSK